MSTLSGIASKGEKGKPRYQSLDINNLYSKSKGDPSETSQHKSTLSRRHGMQPLGKVPSARRPANLPSLKLEYSGNDPAISLVPSGGTGWGSKPGETGLPPTATQVPSSTPPPPSATPTPSAPVAAAVAVSTPTPNTSTAAAPTTIQSQSHADKSWSSITSNSSEMFIGLQSPFFQHEFPSLSGDASASSGSGTNKIDPSHLSGPSLRPQNEGNWIQGGSRPPGQMGAGAGNQQGTVPVPGPLSLPHPHLPQGLDVGGGRSSLGPSGVGVGPAGPMPPLVPFPHYNKLMPPFMLRHNMPAGGFPPNYQHGPQRPRFPYPPDTRFMPPTRGPSNVEQDEVTTRPIIKEEDLKGMDEIGRDTGWAAHDEIDYNQTLSFSDEEGALDDKGKSGRLAAPSNHEKRDQDQKSPERDTNSVDSNKLTQGERQIEEDKDLLEKRRIHNENMAIAVERAKQRKEEEEKRYEESRQNAAKKLKSLEQKMRSKSGVEKEEIAIPPPQNVLHGSNALMPDWEKDRSRKNSEERDEKSSKENLDSFRNTQMENKSHFRERESGGQHGFSRQFASNMPPRLQKQAAPYYRQNSGSGGNVPYDTRWSAPHFGGPMGVGKGYRSHHISESDKSDNSRERDRNSYDPGFECRERERLNESPNRDRNKEDNWKGSGYYEESSISVMNSHAYDSSGKKIPEHHSEPDNISSEKENDRFYDDKGSESKSNESFKPAHSFQDDAFVERDYTQDNKLEPEIRELSHKVDSRERLERPQRPESRDSRASRDSVREDKLLEENCGHESILPWSQSIHDTEHKEEKRRKDFKDEAETRRELHTMQPYQNLQHQRLTPGPITKERLEASEPKGESSRSSNLVPLTKGEIKKSENKWEVEKNSEASWSRAPAPVSHPANSEPELCTPQPPTDVNQESISESQQLNINLEENKATVPKTTYSEREQYETSNSHKSDMQRGSRGGHRGMRHDSRGSKSSASSYFRGGAPMRRGDRGQMPSNRRQHSGFEWGHHDMESEASDEVSASTESGKEDKRLDQDRKHMSRSPRRGIRKSDKDDRSRDGNRKQEHEKNSYSGNENRRYDKKMYEHNRVGAGFEPSGVPSRRGRGAPFRSKGSSTSLGRGMVDGYGPPPTSKKPFSESMSSGSYEDKKADGTSQNQSAHKENGLNEMSNDEKMKLNQQQLSAGIIGNASRGGNLKSQSQSSSSRMPKDGDRRERKPRDNLGWGTRNPVKSGSGSGGEVADEDGETTSEQEDRSCGDEKQNENSRRNYNQGMSRGNNWRQSSNRNYGRDKHSGTSYDRDNSRRPGNHQSVVNGSARFQGGKDQPVVDHSLADKKQPRPEYKEKRNNLDHIDLNNTASVVVVDDQPEVTVEEDQTVFATDNNGFQEVRSKKNVKEGNRQLKEEPQRGSKERPKHSKPPSSQSPGPPGSAMPTGKGGGGGTRAGSLPPRFAKMKEFSRQQKMNQQQQTYDVSELNKLNQVLDFPSKDLTNPAPPPAVNAWDKPITATLRTSTPPSAGLPDTCSIEVGDHLHSTTSSQRSSPNEDKTVGKLPRESVEKALLDGTSPPVQTIIFENTNYKAAPVDVAMKAKYSNPQINKNQRPDKPRDKNIEEDNIGGFKSPGPDIQLQEAKADPIQMPISFTKNEDGADMKLDFRFDSELSQLTDDKSSKTISSIQMTRSIQMTTQSSTADLQFKLDSVKRVWENPVEPSGEDNNTVTAAPSYTPTFANSVEDPSGYGKPNDPSVVGDDNNTPVGVYNPGQQMQTNANAYNGSSVPNMIKPDPSSNVCKVKPQPQSAMHPHAGPLSPPTGAFTSPAQPSHSQHINYQPQAQYGGMSAIPSPPTVFTPSHEQQLYQTFQINNPQVLNNQARSQFSQFAPYMSQSLGQTSGFSQQSMYLHQTAQPPPTAAPAPAHTHPDVYSQFRIQQQAYGANQQLTTNPNTMLISSSTVKPPPQPIGAIGSKATSYQTPSQPPSQVIIYQDPQMINQNYLQNSPLVQRPSNVVPTMPPSSASYYSASTGGNGPGYFQPGNSNLHHLQAAFSGQSPGGTPSMGSFGSTMAQQYCSTAPLYLKTAAGPQDVLSVFSSPATETISPKFRSNACGGSGKQGAAECAPQQQPSSAQGYHKLTSYQQNVSATAQLMIQQQQQQQRGSVNVRRYPGAIQRPDTFQPVARYKLPLASSTATAATAANYYITQKNPTKLVNTNLENKIEPVSKESDVSSTSSSTDKTTDISTCAD